MSKQAPEIKYVEQVNRATGEVERVPEGIDLGWDYNPGRAAWGTRQARTVIRKGESAYTLVVPHDDVMPSKTIPFDTTNTSPDYGIGHSEKQVTAWLRKSFGGDDAVISFVDKNFPAFRHDVHMVADVLGPYIAKKPERVKMLPFLRDVIESPFEIWAAFEESRTTGRVELRYKFIKAVQGDKKTSGIIFLAQVNEGKLQGWNFYTMSRHSELNKNRMGKLIWRR